MGMLSFLQNQLNFYVSREREREKAPYTRIQLGPIFSVTTFLPISPIYPPQIAAPKAFESSLSPTNICFENAVPYSGEGATGTCKGDSGGPLMIWKTKDTAQESAKGAEESYRRTLFRTGLSKGHVRPK